MWQSARRSTAAATAAVAAISSLLHFLSISRHTLCVLGKVCVCMLVCRSLRGQTTAAAAAAALARHSPDEWFEASNQKVEEYDSSSSSIGGGGGNPQIQERDCLSVPASRCLSSSQTDYVTQGKCAVTAAAAAAT